MGRRNMGYVEEEHGMGGETWDGEEHGMGRRNMGWGGGTWDGEEEHGMGRSNMGWGGVTWDGEEGGIPLCIILADRFIAASCPSSCSRCHGFRNTLVLPTHQWSIPEDLRMRVHTSAVMGRDFSNSKALP